MKLPKNFYNPVSLIGSLLASVSLGIIIFSLISMLLFDVGGSYIGLFIYHVNILVTYVLFTCNMNSAVFIVFNLFSRVSVLDSIITGFFVPAIMEAVPLLA